VILLDTNVISEPLRTAPDDAVVNWLDNQTPETLYVSTITQAELAFGLATLPPGKRRDTLTERLDKLFTSLFSGRVLPFDTRAAKLFGTLRAESRRAGQAVADADGFIAAIAAAHGLAVATRDTSPFQAMGLTVINPWAGQE
jgi:predicted nucleic acid-binding protein